MGTVARQTPLGVLVVETREKLGMSQKALAEQAGVATSTVQALESGDYANPQKRTLKKVGKVLGLDLDDSEYDPGPYSDLISHMDEEIQRTLAVLGSWLSGMDPARRRQKLADLTAFMHRDNPDDGPIPKTVHSGPPAPG
jgi:transcriptional regulator with XRE-family HTH domain